MINRSGRTTTDPGLRAVPAPGRRRRLRTGAIAFAVSATMITSVAAGQDLAAASSGVSSGVGNAVLASRWSAFGAGWTSGSAGGGWVQSGQGQGPWSSGQGGWGGYGSGGPGAGGTDGSGSTSGGTSGSTSGSTTSTTATAAESKGVVLINTVLPYDDAEGAGTGMVLTANGEILTNYHVVEGASTIKVTVATTGKTYSATVVGHDATDDVALLQLKNASGLTTVTTDDDSTAVGDSVTAVGNAGGTGTLTAAAGTISALSATITTAAEGSVASETLKSLIQTDADVVAGDSGGPLYDSQGEVVGIDTAASSGSEVDGYAIPIENALTIVAQIRAGNESHGVRIGASAFLGVELADASQTQQGWDQQSGSNAGWSTGSDTVSGATVGGVVSGSAAAEAGLAAGDVITAIGGTTITSADQVSTLLAAKDPGQHVKISWTDTDGATHTATVTLGSSPVA